MSHRYCLLVVALLTLVPAARAVDPSDLKPGLVATFTDQENRSVTRLEPTVALLLGHRESAHPRLSGKLATVTWSGHLNVVRGGKYTFSANMSGQLTIEVAGKLVRNWSETGTPPKVASGGEVVLEGGVLPFTATFKPTEALPAARVELLWKGPGFRTEPLPHRFLGHLEKERPKAFTTDLQQEQGRLAFEEMACIKCHKPAANDAMAKGLVERPGPNLTDIGKRAFPGWIDAWLADPAKLRPHTTMPKMFADGEKGKADRYAVTKYLVSLSGAALEPTRAPTASNEYRNSMDRGRVLYTVTGCASCHQDAALPKKALRNDEDEKEPLKPEDLIYGPVAKYALGALGSKTRPDALAKYLQDPLKVNPGGRMPHMSLTSAEATDIARYLGRVTDEKLATKMPPAPDDDLTEKQWIDRGAKLVVSMGCVNCHAIDKPKPLVGLESFPPLDSVKKAGSTGCIAEKPDAAKVPVFTLDGKKRDALAAFLKTGLMGAGTPSPTHAARATIQRFNCLSCHSKDGEGGFSVELADQMRQLEKAENADDIRPPLLTGIGHKSRTSWLKSVLTGGGRARPWMQLRMPQYGEANVGNLPVALASLEGIPPDDTVHKVAITPKAIGDGRTIVGKGGLGCISCHDISGIANTGTRGPDLATINQRVRYEWYEQWLHQPLRMAPGTRMPQAFVDGKSTLSTSLNGDPKGQAEAMWAYLSLGPGLPLPDGMEPPKGLIIAVKDRPEVLRTFMPEAGAKGIAIGYPGSVSAAFSADQCRLTYAWAGNFLDASPVWNNRGGAPAKLLGPKFWTAPPGHPWGLTTNPEVPPDFLARASNPAYGMPLPLEPARIYDGPMAVGFDGYSLDKTGKPTFRYHLTGGGKDSTLKVTETPVPLPTTVAAGLRRGFEADVPAGYQAWFFAGSTIRNLRIVDAAGEPVKVDESIPASGVRLILPGSGDR
ncbi:MAG TPA: c-type cytochrome, partial [Gemmataceae bacterium]|nr:c-type cytochrome [Gemmataceae bacterium]